MDAEVRTDRDHPVQATRRVVKNAGYLAVADVANKTFMFLFYMVAARHLGVERFGVVSFALALITMLGVLTDLGLGAVATRELARDSGVAGRHVSNTLGLKLVLSLFAVVLINLVVGMLGYPPATVRVVFILSCFVFGNTLASYYCSVFQGFERMDLVAVTRVAQTAVLVGGAFLLSRGAAAPERYALLYVVAAAASMVVAMAAARAVIIQLRMGFDLKEWWTLVRTAAPVGVAVAFTMFYYWNGTTLLSRLRGDAAVGNYSAAFRLITGLTFAGFAFSGAVYPLLSRLFASGSERLSQALQLAVRCMLMLTLPVAAFGVAFAQPITLLLYGQGYSGAVVPLRILGFWGVCASFNSLFSNYFISINRSSTVTIQTGLALAINLALNFFLIPPFGAAGAAVSILTAEAFSLLLLAGRQVKTPARIRAKPVLLSFLRISLALSASMLAAAGVARWGTVVSLLVGVGLYALLLLLVDGINAEDRKLLRPLLKGGSE